MWLQLSVLVTENVSVMVSGSKVWQQSQTVNGGMLGGQVHAGFVEVVIGTRDDKQHVGGENPVVISVVLFLEVVYVCRNVSRLCDKTGHRPSQRLCMSIMKPLSVRSNNW